MTDLSTKQQALDILEACSTVFSLDPKFFTKNTYAKDESGFNELQTSPNAVCWCSVGAMQVAALDLGYLRGNIYTDPSAVTANMYLKTAFRGFDQHVRTWNDSPKRTVQQVIKAFDKAAANLRKEINNAK